MKVLLVAVAGLLLFQDPAPDVAALVEKLRSSDLAEREAAMTELKKLGPAARPELEKFAKVDDIEVGGRIRGLLKVLELRELFTPRLREARPGIEDRLAFGFPAAWTVEYLVTHPGGGKIPDTFLFGEDWAPLAAEAIRGASTDADRAYLPHFTFVRHHKHVAADLCAFLKEPEGGIRRNVYQAVNQFRDLDVLGALIDRVDNEEEGSPLTGILRADDRAFLSPRLLARLKDANVVGRRLALKFLTTLQDPAGISRARDLLSDPDQTIRMLALEYLAAVHAKNVASDIAGLLKDVDARIRGQALFTLHRIGERAEIEKHPELMKDEDPLVRIGLVVALGDSTAGGKLKHAAPFLEDTSRDVRCYATRLLTPRLSPEAFSHLEKMLKDDDPVVRSKAVYTLRSWPAGRAAPILIGMLKDDVSTIRVEAVEQLAAFGWRSAVPEIARILEDQSSDFVAAAIDALDELGAAHCEKAVLEHLKGNHSEAHAAASRFVRNQGSNEAVGKLEEFLESGVPQDRKLAIEALAAAGFTKVISKIIGRLTDVDLDVQVAAAYALADLGAVEAADEIGRGCMDASEHLREILIDALLSLGKVPAHVDVAALVKDQNEFVRRSAIHLAGRSGRPEAASILIGCLLDERGEWTAREELELMDPRSVRSAATEGLKNADGEIRKASLRALLFYGDVASAKDVEPLAKDPVEEVRPHAIVALAQLDPPRGFPILLRELFNPDAGSFQILRKNLEHIRNTTAGPEILKWMDHPDDMIRMLAAQMAARLELREAVPAVRKLLSSRYGEIRTAAITALAALGTAEEGPGLVRFVADKDPRAAEAAIDAVAKFKAPGAFKSALGMIHHPDWALRDRAICQLWRLGAPEELATFLGDRASEHRREALAPISVKERPELAPVIAGLMKDPEEMVRVNALRILVEAKAPQAEALVLKGLESPEPSTRSTAAQFAGVLGLRAAIPGIRAQLREADPGVRETATQSLGGLGATEAVSDLESLLEDDYPEVRRAAAAQLAKLGSKASIPAVKKLLADPHFKVRGQAAEALCLLGSREAAPALLRFLRAELSFHSGEPRPELRSLNGLRNPEVFQKLKSLNGTWTGSLEVVLKSIGDAVGLPIDMPLKGATASKVGVRTSALEFLKDIFAAPLFCNLDIVIEKDRIRLVSDREALRLWRAWVDEGK